MTGFEEYAALVRELSVRQRGGERAVAAEAERRRGLHAAADQLGQRLTAQGQRLDQLGRAIGAAGPLAVPEGTPAVAALASPSAVPPSGAGAGATGGAAAAPGRPEVGAYPEGTVPAPRTPEPDPVAELAAARQLADEADRYGQQAESIAHRPTLLPTWSAAARAVAVYAACALAGSVLMAAAALSPASQAVGLGLVLAVSCTGIPLLSFLAGHLILGRWGRPVMDAGPPSSRYVPLGFVICALLSPSLYCAVLVAARLA
ncbi:hypothetical protein [Micromonospora eburnea]|uniref:Uncharacterized protein n=1 Tax=Micromonospora eburnea TaxID=227316 RepID=A0A1C6V5J2_9ACTN|nr:hypothetical protein [Micromonospora eburnea]SCL61545.1 hypothetical protein GA0070604_4539 [Micromonospora eburnea]